MSNQINKKQLAEQLKERLNSPDYVKLPSLIKYEDRLKGMITWLFDEINKEENCISFTKDINFDGRRMVKYGELEPED
jgi:hypothetical protein